MSERLSRGRQLAGASALLLVAVIATFAYGTTMRAAADEMTAKGTIHGVKTFISELEKAKSPGEFEMWLPDVAILAENYLRSDSAARLPEVTAHVRAAWTAIRAAREIMRAGEKTDGRPLVESMPAVPRALAVVPELGTLVLGSGPDARIDNGDARAVRLLMGRAAEEIEAADRLLAR